MIDISKGRAEDILGCPKMFQVMLGPVRQCVAILHEICRRQSRTVRSSPGHLCWKKTQWNTSYQGIPRQLGSITNQRSTNQLFQFLVDPLCLHVEPPLNTFRNTWTTIFNLSWHKHVHTWKTWPTFCRNWMDFPVFKSYGMKNKQKSQLLISTGLPELFAQCTHIHYRVSESSVASEANSEVHIATSSTLWEIAVFSC